MIVRLSKRAFYDPLVPPGTEAYDTVGGALRPKWREWPVPGIIRAGGLWYRPSRALCITSDLSVMQELRCVRILDPIPTKPSCVVSFFRRFRTAHFSADRRTEVCQLV